MRRKPSESALLLPSLLSDGRKVKFGAALALSRCPYSDGDLAQRLADEMTTRFPENTEVQFNFLPTLQGQLALDRKNSKDAS